jgi:hypothetical protein
VPSATITPTTTPPYFPVAFPNTGDGSMAGR